MGKAEKNMNYAVCKNKKARNRYNSIRLQENKDYYR